MRILKCTAQQRDERVNGGVCGRFRMLVPLAGKLTIRYLHYAFKSRNALWRMIEMDMAVNAAAL